jgi:hypothetical protein
MAARDGSPGLNGAAKGPAVSRKSLLLGLSLLAADRRFRPPAQARRRPLRQARRQVRRMKLAFDKVIEKRPPGGRHTGS